MICETYNWILNVLYWCFGSTRPPVSRVSATDFTIIFICFILFMVIVSWWLVPIMRGLDRLEKIEFHCKVNKE